MNLSSPRNLDNNGKSPARHYRAALAMVTTLFFFWGFVTVLNDVLVPHLKSIFELNYARVMLIQFAFFSAYFVFSLPAAWLIDSIGYKRTMVTGLVTMKFSLPHTESPNTARAALKKSRMIA